MVEQIETLFVADPHVLSDLSWTLFQNPERVVSDVVRRSGLRNYALGSATCGASLDGPILERACPNTSLHHVRINVLNPCGTNNMQAGQACEHMGFQATFD